MRRFCYIVVSAALLLTGCQLTSVEQDVLPEEAAPVTFSAYSGSGFTKAPIADLTTLQGNGFLMYANVNVPGVSEPQQFMNAQKIVWNSSAWTYSPIKYWPTTDGATVDFYPRYTDGSDNVKITYDWNNIPQVTFYVNSTVSEQTDMLWAAPIFGAEREDYADGVNINFKHALTSFFFKIKLASDYEKTVVKVKSITLEGYFAPKATLNVNQTEFNNDIWSLQGDWDKRSYTISTEGDNEIYSGISSGISTTLTKVTGEKGKIMVLPFGNTEYTVTLVYDLDVTDDDGNTSTSTYSVSYTKSSADLKPGVQVVSNLVLTLNKINFNATLSDFTKTDVDY